MSVGAVNKQTGDRIPTAGIPAIDNALSAISTNPVQNAIITAALANKQDKTDNNLQTTDKTVVGAINEHEGDISSLMSGLTNYENQNNLNLEVPNRKNLCDNSKNGVGYYGETGVYQDNVHYATSDLIPVEQGKTYVASIFNKTTSERIGALVYTTWDASKNFIAQSTSATITIGSGVSYVRIRNFQDQTTYIDGDNFVYQLEQGSTATAYTPYIPSVESRIEAVENGIARIVCTEIVYDDSASLFTLPSGVPKPKDGAQIMVCGRNRSTGAIYALWFDNSASGFKIGKILEGSAPADGISISVQYIA